MKTQAYASALIAVIALSVAGTGLMVYRQRPVLPVAGLLHRSTVDPTVDRGGHSRGIVQVDLLRQIIADRARAVPAAAEQVDKAWHRVPSQANSLLGRAAPALVLEDAERKTRDLQAAATEGPVVIVFYLGSSCVACMTHLVEMDAAMPRFQARSAKVWAVSADRPELSQERMRRFGSFRIPLLSDSNHAVSKAFGVWKPDPAGNPDDGEALHGTFIVGRGGSVRWAYIGDRPFTDIDALLANASPFEPSPADP